MLPDWPGIAMRTMAPIEPTLLLPGLLGADRSSQAWRRTQRDFLGNAIPIDTRIGLLCVAWEQKDGPSAIHSTGMSLLGHEADPIDLRATWTAMADDPEMRHAAIVTRHLALGNRVPEAAIRRVYTALGPLRTAWQDLVGYAMWAEALFKTHLPLVAPLDDPRLDAWLGQLLQAGAAVGPFVRPPSGQALLA